METQLGVDFSAVRVHTDEPAAALTRALDAWAFTVGSDVYFEPGAYAPRTTSGRALLAHELVHVIQQSGPSRSAGGAATDVLESEARQAAAGHSRAQVGAGTVRPGTVQLAGKEDVVPLRPSPVEPVFGGGKPPVPEVGQTPFSFVAESPALGNYEEAVRRTVNGFYDQNFTSYDAAVAHYRQELAKVPANERPDYARRIFDRVRKAFYRAEGRNPSFDYTPDQLARLKNGAAPTETFQLEHLTEIKDAPEGALSRELWYTKGGKGGTQPTGTPHQEKAQRIPERWKGAEPKPAEGGAAETAKSPEPVKTEPPVTAAETPPVKTPPPTTAAETPPVEGAPSATAAETPTMKTTPPAKAAEVRAVKAEVPVTAPTEAVAEKAATSGLKGAAVEEGAAAARMGRSGLTLRGLGGAAAEFAIWMMVDYIIRQLGDIYERAKMAELMAANVEPRIKQRLGELKEQAERLTLDNPYATVYANVTVNLLFEGMADEYDDKKEGIHDVTYASLELSLKPEENLTERHEVTKHYFPLSGDRIYTVTRTMTISLPLQFSEAPEHLETRQMRFTAQKLVEAGIAARAYAEPATFWSELQTQRFVQAYIEVSKGPQHDDAVKYLEELRKRPPSWRSSQRLRALLTPLPTGPTIERAGP